MGALVGGGRGGDVHQVCLEHIAREGGTDRVVVFGALVFGGLIGGDVGEDSVDPVTWGGAFESVELVRGREPVVGERMRDIEVLRRSLSVTI